MPGQRIVDLTSGMTMVVTDLHGDRDAFARYAGRFLQLRSRRKVERLLLLGDVIHSNGPEHEDASLSMILDILRMRQSLGSDAVMMLLGNHEMPHLYGTPLQRGNFEYTPRFEKALSAGGRRDEIISFFDSLPFYVRTAAGITLTHAGPDGNVLSRFEQIRAFDHQTVLNEYGHALSLHPRIDEMRLAYSETMGMPYEVMARYYLAVSGPEDPRYNDLLRSFMISQKSTEFELLWDALFTRCEKSMTMSFYERLLARFLDVLSGGDAPAKQQVMVTGHIEVRGGSERVTPRHLRLASAAHASPREAGQYLLFDPARPVNSVDDLIPDLGSVFGP
jgi:hypothetical protein